MPEVYVVRQFFEDCNDASYTGVYSDFYKAVSAAVADAKENWDEPEYTFNVHLPISRRARWGEVEEEETELWCEIFHDGKPYGIYYTITKMELDK